MQSLKAKLRNFKNQHITRRYFLFTASYTFILSTVVFGCSQPAKNTQQEVGASNISQTQTAEKSAAKLVRIVRSKQLSSLAILEKQGNLKKRLETLGYKLEWPEFAAGPQQLEALNAGGLDIASTAETPPIFSQAAGAPLVYLATTGPSSKAVSLIVPVKSSINSVKDLKGKKIAFQKASIGHYLLLKAVEKEGFKLSDVSSVYLPPPDANVAFSQGKVDGWFIWEPFVTRNVEQKVGRVLIDGSNLRDTGNFYSTTRSFYQKNPQVIKVFLEELQKAEIWGKAHPKEVAQLLSPVTQLDPPLLEKMHSKYDWDLRP
ncbi:aliphatic sulfonate ABC transporter substrate-binding protein, partial [Aetokthonos hydrillicola]